MNQSEKAIHEATKLPRACPHCGNTEVEKMHLFVTDWFAHSLDPQDLENTGILAEHQCHSCSNSFWL